MVRQRLALFAFLSAGLMSAQNRLSAETPQHRPAVVSADLLRHPINEKARRMLRSALETINSGDHETAIQQLRDVLRRYPESAAYVHSLLGIEYFRTNRFSAAVESFVQAVALLPHDAVNRYNLGLSLLCNGDVERGEQELRRAVELDPNNPTVRALWEALEKLPR